MVEGSRATLLSPPHVPQDSDVLLHWAPVEEAGDPTQIVFSKKVGAPLLFATQGEGRGYSGTCDPVCFVKRPDVLSSWLLGEPCWVKAWVPISLVVWPEFGVR